MPERGRPKIRCSLAAKAACVPQACVRVYDAWRVTTLVFVKPYVASGRAGSRCNNELSTLIMIEGTLKPGCFVICRMLNSPQQDRWNIYKLEHWWWHTVCEVTGCVQRAKPPVPGSNHTLLPDVQDPGLRSDKMSTLIFEAILTSGCLARQM